MKVRPSKCRSLSISKGKLLEERFYIDSEVIPSIAEKPVKNLSTWYNSYSYYTIQWSTFSDRLQSLENSSVIATDKTFLPGKLKGSCWLVGKLLYCLGCWLWILACDSERIGRCGKSPTNSKIIKSMLQSASQRQLNKADRSPLVFSRASGTDRRPPPEDLKGRTSEGCTRIRIRYSGKRR